MKQHVVALVLFFAIISYVANVMAQDDIVFPGPTERPSRFPIRTTRPTRTTTRPTRTTTRPTTQRTTDRPITQDTTTTSSGSGVSPTIEEYNTCVNNCQTTSEYNPVCGTDGVVYSNPGRLGCAQRCGNPVEKLKNGQCVDNPRG